MPPFRKRSLSATSSVNGPPPVFEYIKQKFTAFHPRTKNKRTLAASSNTIAPHRVASASVSPSRDPTDIAANQPGSSKESGWSAAYGAARMAVKIANASTDMFLPLKAVVGALSVLLKNFDQTTANEDQIKDIEKRVQSLREVFASPAGDHDGEEKARRRSLGRKLAEIIEMLKPLSEQHGIAKFLKNADHAIILNGFVQDLAYAIMDYQTSLQQGIHKDTVRIDERTKKIHESTQNLIEAADLEILGKLGPVHNGGYQAGHHDTCLRGTRESVLNEIVQWAEDPREHQ